MWWAVRDTTTGGEPLSSSSAMTESCRARRRDPSLTGPVCPEILLLLLRGTLRFPARKHDVPAEALFGPVA